MPWLETAPMDERLQFIQDSLSRTEAQATATRPMPASKLHRSIYGRRDRVACAPA